MKKLNKKAFTIVELVIVIAVIAILAGVLIPTFVGLVRKSRVSTDTQLVRNLNTALAEDGVNNEHNTMTDVLAVAEDYGYVVAKLNAKAKDNEILWDSANDVFCYLNDGKVEYLPDSVKDGKKLESGDYRLWKIYNKAPTDGEGYSIYVASQAAADYVANNEVSVGVDCGEYLIDAVSYKNTGAAQNDVVIRTNSASTTLTIDAASDTVKHFGSAGNVDIKAVANASYHENGTVAFLEVATGRVALESDSKVAQIHLTATAGSFNDITVAKAPTVQMPEFSRDAVDIPAEGKLVVALQDGTADANAAKDFVWLTAVGIYEQVTISDSKDTAGTTYAADSDNGEQKAAAAQIANNITATVGGNEYTLTATKTGETWTYTLTSESEEDITEAVTVAVSESVATVSVSGTEQTTTTDNGLTAEGKEEAKAVVINEALEVERKEEFNENNYWIGVAADSFAGGNGTESNPYQIATAQQLARLAWGMSEASKRSAFNNKYYVLTADINLTSKCWVPIAYNNRKASADTFFSGSFDGNNHTIKGLNNVGFSISLVNTMQNGSTPLNGEEYVYGLFGSVGSVTIKDLTLTDVNIKTGTGETAENGIKYLGDSVGALIGNAATSFAVSNVKVSGLVQGYDCVGGIIGRSNAITAASSIVDCENYATVNGVRQTAGVVGTSKGSLTEFTRCKNHGAVTTYFIDDYAYSKNYYVVAGISELKSGSANATDCVNDGTLTNRRLDTHPNDADAAKYKVIDLVAYGN